MVNTHRHTHCVNWQAATHRCGILLAFSLHSVSGSTAHWQKTQWNSAEGSILYSFSGHYFSFQTPVQQPCTIIYPRSPESIIFRPPFTAKPTKTRIGFIFLLKPMTLLYQNKEGDKNKAAKNADPTPGWGCHQLVRGIRKVMLPFKTSQRVDFHTCAF